MISSGRLAQMAKNWLRATVAARKRITFPKGGSTTTPDSVACSATAPAGKGRFVVYSSDGRRFEVPLAYLNSHIFRELLRMSEDVFGLPSAGPITLPCDSAFMCSVVSYLEKRSSRNADQRALLAAIAALPYSASLAPCSLSSWMNPQLVVCGC